MTVIRESTVDEVLTDVGELFSDHWDEVALNKRLMVLKPDIDRYKAMEASGLTMILAAYDGGQLIGYSVNFIMKHLHYADLVIANNDLLFLAKERRTGRLGIQLIRETERVAKEKGATLMLWHAKKNTPLAGVMPRMGYGVQDIIFSKEI